MRYFVSTTVVVTCTVLSMLSFPAPAQSDSAIERDALARELAGAWLPLESGLVLSSTEGTPLSAKYELEDGTLQLSVYTLKPDGTFSEVIVDFSAGMIARVDTIADGEDLVAAQSQKAAMAGAKRSLDAVTADALKASPGYRAVSAMPGLTGGRPTAEVILLRGNDWKVVTAPLD